MLVGHSERVYSGSRLARTGLCQVRLLDSDTPRDAAVCVLTHRVRNLTLELDTRGAWSRHAANPRASRLPYEDNCAGRDGTGWPPSATSARVSDPPSTLHPSLVASATRGI